CGLATRFPSLFLCKGRCRPYLCYWASFKVWNDSIKAALRWACPFNSSITLLASVFVRYLLLSVLRLVIFWIMPRLSDSLIFISFAAAWIAVICPWLTL